MSQRVEKLAILFADICGSTALYEKYGDDLARKMIARCIKLMEGQIAAHHGTLIKTIGDEIMVTFPSAEAAFHAACSMQQAVEEDHLQDGVPMHIRIGFNYGDVIQESNDVFGNTVNVAARIAAITRAGQSMATHAVYEALPFALQSGMRQIMRAEFKGKQDQLEIYQIVIEKEDMQSTRIGMPAYRKSAGNNDEMILSYRDRTLKVNKERRSVTLGRGEACDIVVQNNLASRLHLRIELRFGKFIVADLSTNGTYIRYSDGDVAHITREETVLKGNGAISLGQLCAENPAEVIEFSITSVQVLPK